MEAIAVAERSAAAGAALQGLAATTEIVPRARTPTAMRAVTPAIAPMRAVPARAVSSAVPRQAVPTSAVEMGIVPPSKSTPAAAATASVALRAEAAPPVLGANTAALEAVSPVLASECPSQIRR